MTLDGIWWNDLKSEMEISRNPDDPCEFTGFYHTHVGEPESRTYPLAGRCYGQDGTDQTVGWVIDFDLPGDANTGRPSDPSLLTAWRGQLHRLKVAGETIEFLATTWIFTRVASTPYDWQSPWVNQDYFFRTPPTDAQLEGAKNCPEAMHFFS